MGVKKTSKETEELILKLIKEQYHASKISKMLNVPVCSINRIAKENNVEVYKKTKIANEVKEEIINIGGTAYNRGFALFGRFYVHHRVHRLVGCIG